MENQLSPLPPPFGWYWEDEDLDSGAPTNGVYRGDVPEYLKQNPALYTADQLREYARKAVEAEREACAKVASEVGYDGVGCLHALQIANAIRARR